MQKLQIEIDSKTGDDIYSSPEDFDLFISRGNLMANVYGVHTPIQIVSLKSEYKYLFGHIFTRCKSWEIIKQKTNYCVVMKF